MSQHEYSPEIRTVLDYVLEDDASPRGGIDHYGETVREYLASVEGDGTRYNTLPELNKALSASGIKPIESVRPSLHARLNEARQERDQERVRWVINALDRAMKQYRYEWRSASNDYLIADAHFICAVKDAYAYLTKSHRFTPEEVDWMLRMPNPLHSVAVKWSERQSNMRDFPIALEMAIRERREKYKRELEAR